MNNAELLNLMNLLRSTQKTQEAILQELKKLNAPIKVGAEELNYDVGTPSKQPGNIGYI